MKAFAQIVLLSILLGFSVQNVFADGLPPSEEDVCDVLQGDGITGGLFGLCNAYCEAKDCDEYPAGEEPRSCNRILANYENKRDRANNPLDPEMPCLVEDTVSCPCWTPEQFDDRGLGLDPVGCLVNVPGLGSLVEYGDNSDMVVFASTPEPGCEYDNTLVLDPDTNLPIMVDMIGLTVEEDAACQADVATLVAEVAGDVPGGCVVFPDP